MKLLWQIFWTTNLTDKYSNNQGSNVKQLKIQIKFEIQTFFLFDVFLGFLKLYFLHEINMKKKQILLIKWIIK